MNKSTRESKKLSLRKERIRTLALHELKVVVGGVETDHSYEGNNPTQCQ